MKLTLVHVFAISIYSASQYIHEPKWLFTQYLFFGSLFNPRMYFLLVNLVRKTNNRLGIRDVFANLIDLDTIVTAPHKFRDHSGLFAQL